MRAGLRAALVLGMVVAASSLGASPAFAAAPTVTIDQAPTQGDPASAAPISFVVKFSEPVTGFAAVDVVLSGSAGGTLSGVVSGSGATYTVAVTGMTTGGTVVATIGAGAAQNAAAPLPRPRPAPTTP